MSHIPNRRQNALNFAIEYLGHENPFTIAICTISEEYPEKEYDSIIGDLVETYVMRYFDSINEDDEDETPPEDDNLWEDFSDQISINDVWGYDE